MASQITSIYAAIQAMSVSVGGNAITTRGLAVHDGQVHTLPQRILTPLTTNDDGRQLLPLTFGNRQSIEWRITDLMLWASVTSGSGIEYHIPKLVEYMGAFADAIVTLDRNLGLANVVQVGVDDIEIGVYTYPAESGTSYYGAKTTWRVRENL